MASEKKFHVVKVPAMVMVRLPAEDVAQAEFLAQKCVNDAPSVEVSEGKRILSMRPLITHVHSIQN